MYPLINVGFRKFFPKNNKRVYTTIRGTRVVTGETEPVQPTYSSDTCNHVWNGTPIMLCLVIFFQQRRESRNFYFHYFLEVNPSMCSVHSFFFRCIECK